MANESIIIKENFKPDETVTAETGGNRQRELRSDKKNQATKPKRKPDPYILGIYLVLVVISIIEIFSASSTEVKADNIYGPLKRHALFLILGGAIVFSMQKIHYRYLRNSAWLFGILSFGLLVFSSWFGANINGAQRAILIGGFTIQPAEIVKFTVVLLLAKVLSNNQQEGDVKISGVFTAAVVVVIFSALLWMNGLTNMILLMGVSVAMFLIGGISIKKLAAVGAAYAFCGCMLFYMKYQDSKGTEFDQVAAVAAGPGQQVQTEHEIGRMSTHKNRFANYFKGVAPDDEITDENRQVWFATMAQAHGGVFGKGPGNSRESARLPLAFSDYIYSIIVEDSGLVGGVVLLILYLCIVARAGVVAYRLRKAFPTFLIMGCAVMIVFQALVHMAIVTGVVPVSGQPLPFISKGGTSVLVMSVAVGAMLSVSRFAEYREEDISQRKSKKEKKAGEQTPEGLVPA